MAHRFFFQCGRRARVRKSPTLMYGCSSITLSRTISTTNLLHRAIKSVKNDPFIKLSLSLCALVVGGTIFMELFKKFKKNTTSAITILPPGFGHHSIKRDSLLLHMRNQLKKLNSKCQPAVFYVTGPGGCGKTELIRQFCENYHSRKWFGLKTVPCTVVSLDATSPQHLRISLKEAASNLRLSQESSPDDTLSMILAELSTKHLPWLLVIDNLTKDTNSLFQKLINGCLAKVSPLDGTVLVTTQFSELAVDECSLHLTPRFNLEQSLELLGIMSGFKQCKNLPSVLELIEVVDNNPMAIALAAATIKILDSLLPTAEYQAVVSSYNDLLTQALNNDKDSDILQTCLDLYCEAAISDSRFRHTFDFLGSCDLKYPVTASVLPVHLGLELYGISNEMLAPPPLNPILDKLNSHTQKSSYWDQVKSMIPLVQNKVPSDDDIANALAASQDEISFLRESPIFSFQRSYYGDLEFVRVHSAAAPQLSKLFLESTAVKLDQDHVSKEALEFEQNAWFKQYRSFDMKKSLESFHRKLPGLSSPGVLTEAQFNAIGVTTPQDQLLSDLTYSQYLHIVSHYHRVISSLTSTVRSAKGEMAPIVMDKSMVPHFQIIKACPYLSDADRLSLDISLVAIQALTKNCVDEYKHLVVKQKALLGAKNIMVAHSLVDLADLHLSMNAASAAKEYLLSALEIYQQVPSHQCDGLALHMGHALSSLGLACGQLRELQQSKNFYEQALAASQSVSENGRVSLKQRQLVASALVDVTHAYLCLGELAVAKKYCELAAMMLQSVYPQGHMETVRLLNISSIVSALMGNKQGSTKYRTEASKVKSKIECHNL